MTDTPPGYDVFLCHNGKDKPVVRKLRDALKQRQIRTWFDEDQLIPGRPWQEALEQAIQSIGAAAICVGPSGIGPWQDREMRAYIQEFVNQSATAVIPVLLPGVTDVPDLPLFLKPFHWVDLRDGVNGNGFRLLICGIRGTEPGETLVNDLDPTENQIQRVVTISENASTDSTRPSDVGPGDPDELLPRVVQFLHELPENDPDLHDEIIRALRFEFPELKKQRGDTKPIDLVEVIDSKGLHSVLAALYCWLDCGVGPRISTDGWRRVLTHLVVLAAAKTWLPQGRTQRDHDGVVSVGNEGYPLQPLSAAVLVSGLFDVAVHLEGNRPTGYVELSGSTGNRGYDIEDRYDALRRYLQERFQKYLEPGSPPLDDGGIKQMLEVAIGQRRPLFVMLRVDDALAKSVSEHLGGLLTVLEETPTAPCVLDKSLGLLKYMEDLLEKLQLAP